MKLARWTVILFVAAFAISLAAVVSTGVHYLSLRHMATAYQAARACTAAEVEKGDTGACWLDVDAAVKRIACHGGTCTVQLMISRNGAVVPGRIRLAAGEARGLHAGASAKARLLEGQVMALVVGGELAERSDRLQNRGGDLLITLAIFAVIALVSGLRLLHIRAAARARRKPGARPPADWAAVLDWLLVIVGVGNIIIMPFLYFARRAEAQAYATAPTCAPEAEATSEIACRTVVPAEVVHTYCKKILFVDHCEISFRLRIAGAAVKQGAMLSNADTQALLAAGTRTRIELYGPSVTKVEVRGHLIPVMGRPAEAMNRIIAVIAAAVAMALLGAYLLFRRAVTRRVKDQ